jgi:predicted XRE-type DNA-binding protein
LSHPAAQSDPATCSRISPPDADNLLLKSPLVAKIDEVIEKRGLTRAAAGRIMGISQRKISELRNGRIGDYSVEHLYRLLYTLGVGVSVVLEELPDRTKGEVAVREADAARA